MDTSTFGSGIEILGPITAEYSEILDARGGWFHCSAFNAHSARGRIELLARRG
jgi:hypothetical protein